MINLLLKLKNKTFSVVKPVHYNLSKQIYPISDRNWESPLYSQIKTPRLTNNKDLHVQLDPYSETRLCTCIKPRILKQDFELHVQDLVDVNRDVSSIASSLLIELTPVGTAVLARGSSQCQQVY